MVREAFGLAAILAAVLRADVSCREAILRTSIVTGVLAVVAVEGPSVCEALASSRTERRPELDCSFPTRTW
jgi:hypothetical protein